MIEARAAVIGGSTAGISKTENTRNGNASSTLSVECRKGRVASFILFSIREIRYPRAKAFLSGSSCGFALQYVRVAHYREDFFTTDFTDFTDENFAVQNQFPIREIREIRGSIPFGCGWPRCVPLRQKTSWNCMIPRYCTAKIAFRLHHSPFLIHYS